MKKFLSILLIAFCIFGLTAFTDCNNDTNETNEPERTPIEIELNIAENLKQFNSNSILVGQIPAISLYIGLEQDIDFKIEITIFANNAILRIVEINKNEMRQIQDHFLNPTWGVNSSKYVFRYIFSRNEYPNMTRVEVTKLIGIFYQ